MSISFGDIAEILKAIDESQADEIELDLDGFRLRVRKRGGGMQPSIFEKSGIVETQQQQSEPQQTETPPSPQIQQPVDTPEGYLCIRSPMTGTFYRRPSPDEAPYVEIGSKVKQGDALCLIEVMKLFTTIEATSAGVIESIYPEDNQLVEFDQPLFLISSSS